MGLIEDYRALIDRRLSSLFAHVAGDRVAEAQAYAVLQQASRLRPITLLCAAECFGARAEDVLDAAAAVELVHSGVVMLSDVPAMEFTLLRRDRPPAYKVFGEACCFLAAGSLIGRAFGLLCSNLEALKVPKPKSVEAIKSMSDALASDGLFSGMWQEYRLTEYRMEVIQQIHAKRTGLVFQLAAKLGGILGGAKKAELEVLETYGRDIGLAVRIIEDMWEYLEGEDSSRKPLRRELRPANLVKLIGQEAARDMANNLLISAKEVVDSLSQDTEPLVALAEYIEATGLVRKPQ